MRNIFFLVLHFYSLCYSIRCKFSLSGRCSSWSHDPLQEPILRPRVTTPALQNIYNASAVKKQRRELPSAFWKQNYFLRLCKNALVYFNAGVVVVYSEVDGSTPALKLSDCTVLQTRQKKKINVQEDGYREKGWWEARGVHHNTWTWSYLMMDGCMLHTACQTPGCL
jgi:hypothetical protein